MTTSLRIRTPDPHLSHRHRVVLQDVFWKLEAVKAGRLHRLKKVNPVETRLRLTRMLVEKPRRQSMAKALWRPSARPVMESPLEA